MTTLLTVVIAIAIVGVIIWAIQTYVPMPPWAKGLITVVCVVGLLLWLLKVVNGHHVWIVR